MSRIPSFSSRYVTPSYPTTLNPMLIRNSRRVLAYSIGDCVSDELPFAYRDVAPPDVLAYQDGLPSCPYWQWQGKHEEPPAAVVWTDGSRRDLGPEMGLRVGYGSYSTHPRYCMSGQVGGEAVPIRGEYAAIAMVLQAAPPSQPLAILTDCLSAIQVLQHWRHQDFLPCAEDELHWDIGHRGDPGNTKADKAADLGCLNKEDPVVFDRNTYPLQFYARDSGKELSPNGWTAGVERFSRQYEGQLSSAHLVQKAAPAKSTLSLLRADSDRGL
eukprot:1584285-Rhodomonas_salina.1